MSSSTPSIAYTIEVSSMAWKQLSYLSLESYQQLRSEVDAVAARMASLGKPALVFLKTVCQVSLLSLVVGEYVVLYDLDPERGRLTLQEVARRLPDDSRAQVG
ncbi:MAG TPA: hypothetical protein VF794_05240 [Archangium sp.]|jgi:mRNA-degrading endonuclease RelE of RelBE toxin-antitoxin system|uniref:type II toxin-antitoxin system RelE family toxin n=1 Tax=Archangium sp. TaxID=1872627 RepID=UPI002ED9D23F